eukprot:CAMPEP_0116139982 /NCGR_PEP_ID=MMETSP0329-20121206/13598_1 /TAXON_ID=697910 /ORGANISM="Pseudo-nitzschia arenysensis, Strain B593" /LENGTH=190 /DNA_ID=CAMNT_0003635053 /DNA_START=1 /DNA_END=570 /DNA_ORIENTATION=-
MSSATEESVEKLELDQPVIPIIPIGIALPPSISPVGGNGIVGSIVIMGQKSAMVWVSFGPLDTTTEKQSSGVDTNQSFASFGKGTPAMGQLVVAMPRTNYKGAFGTGSKEPSCSQLVGSSSSEDQMLANQMASRLSSRSGMAIYVSCQLSSSSVGGPGSNSGGGMDPFSSGVDAEFLSHHAAALAEKEIW